jgi:hypothetical protein
MKSKWVWALLVGVLGAALYGGTVQATPPSGVTVTPLAPVAQFGEINAKAKIGDWKAKLKTKESPTSTSYRSRFSQAAHSAGTNTRD